MTWVSRSFGTDRSTWSRNRLAALGKGAALDRPRLSEALRTGFVFGIIEAVTPVMGWSAGVAASSYITAIDHWIAFALLTVIGAKMIWESAPC
jgi:putative Mn2+ efflux pump MntP